MRPRKDLKEKLYAGFVPEPTTGCWLWFKNAGKHGHGLLRHGSGSAFLAHRVSWEIHRGPIPKGLFVCHKCDTPQCINPDHLFTGTPRDNTRDMMNKGRSRFPQKKTHCKNGHLFSNENVVKMNASRRCKICLREYGKLWIRNKRKLERD